MLRFLFFIALIYPSILFCQGFNKFLAASNYTYSDINNILIENDTIVTYGIGIIKEGANYRQGLLFRKFDSLGVLIKDKLVLDSIGKSLSMDKNYYGNVVKKKGGGYIAICSVVENEDVLFMVLDHNFEVLSIEKFTDTTYLSNFDYKVHEIAGGYLLYGAIQWPPKAPSKNGKVVGFVRKIDTQGNTDWVKYYEPSSFMNDVGDLKTINDSTYVFLLNSRIESNDPFNATVFHSLYIIDDKGKTLKSWRTVTNDPNFYYIYNIVSVQGDEILTFGHKFIDIYYQGAASVDKNFRPYFAAFDSKTLASKWQKYCGIKANISEFGNRLYGFTRSNDGNYVGAGQMNINEYLTKDNSEYWAWINKFSPQGETLWSRKISYPSNLPDNITEKKAGELYGVGVLSSGSIVAGGYVEVGNRTYGYLVKMNNDGCLDTLFKCDNTISVTTAEASKEHVLVYPNPTSGDFMVRLSANPDGYMLTLRDMNGNPITTQSVMPNTLESSFVTDNISNGIYFLEVIPKTGVSTFHKVIFLR